MITTLRIKKEYENSYDLGIKWFGIISLLNDFKWTPLEIRVLVFTALKGDISSGGRRKLFCETFKSTKLSLNNIVSELHKKSFLVRVEGKLKIHPQLLIDFDNDFSIRLNLIHGSTE